MTEIDDSYQNRESERVIQVIIEPEGEFSALNSFVHVKQESVDTDDDFFGSDLEVLTVLRNEKSKRRIINNDDDDDWQPKRKKKRTKEKITESTKRSHRTLIPGCPETIVVTPQFQHVTIKEEPYEDVEESIIDEAKRLVERRWVECATNGNTQFSWRLDGRYKVQKFPQAEVDIVSQRLKREREIPTRGKNRKFQCKHCDETFSIFSDLRKHMLVHQVETRHKCQECGKCFPRGCDLSLHRRTHSQMKAFVCEFCQRGFSQKINMERHIKSVHENSMERPFHCDLCQQTFVGRSDLRKHLRRHEGPMPFFCPTCGYRFYTYDDLQMHLSTESHGIDLWLCRTCDTVILKEDRKPHTEEHRLAPKPFVCNYCSHSFALKASLQKHLPVHTGVRAFVCRYCNSSFTSEPAHRSHIIRHTLLRERQCPHCPKVFYTVNSLSKHLKSHSNERKYKCSMCPASFKVSDAKKKHETIHEKSRLRYRCVHPGCGVSLTTKSNMERHMASIHLGIRRHKCQYCQRGYSMRCDCLRHEDKCPKNPDNKGKTLRPPRKVQPAPTDLPTPERMFINKRLVNIEIEEDQSEVILGTVGGDIKCASPGKEIKEEAVADDVTNRLGTIENKMIVKKFELFAKDSTSNNSDITTPNTTTNNVEIYPRNDLTINIENIIIQQFGRNNIVDRVSGNMIIKEEIKCEVESPNK